MNPSRIAPESLPLFVEHNLKLFREADMAIAPMVLDRDPPSPEVKDAFCRFAPGGYATIVADVLGRRGTYPEPQVWKGMPVLELYNDTCNSKEPAQIAGQIAKVIKAGGNTVPGFYLFRCVWVNPTTVKDARDVLRREHPDLQVQVVDVYTFFELFKRSKSSPAQ